MTSFDATVPLAAAIPLAPARGIARFVGDKGAFWRLNLPGALLLMATLGIYRFWLNTDIRRFLWSNTLLDDESVEYTGTARELLLGFLFAITVLVPINAALFAASLNLVLGQLSSVIAFVLLAVLGQFAVYRARRYRLTRTIYRGVRFHQDGSGWRYATCALFWWAMIAFTLGLAYPFAQSRLERFKMRYTFFGDLGWGLFFRGLLMWLIVMGPFLAGVLLLAIGIDWPAVITAAGQGDTSNATEIFGRMAAASPDFGAKLGIPVGALIWAVLAAFLLYPVFQAMLLRWWAPGLRFGQVAVTSRLRTGRVYGAYARFIALSMAYSMAVGTVMGMVFGLVGVTLASADAQSKEIGNVGVGILSYVIFMLGSSAIYQVTVRLALWQNLVESLEVEGTAALDQAKAQGVASSAFGEGLADALNVGGL